MNLTTVHRGQGIGQSLDASFVGVPTGDGGRTCSHILYHHLIFGAIFLVREKAIHLDCTQLRLGTNQAKVLALTMF